MKVLRRSGMSLTCSLLLKLERKLFEISRDKLELFIYLRKKEILFLARTGFVSVCPVEIKETKL